MLLKLLSGCVAVSGQSLGMEELRKIFETLDKDNSGAIDFLEFLQLN